MRDNKAIIPLHSAPIEQMLDARGYEIICGVDEAGRGPLAGPVVAAAVILHPDTRIEGLTDSKKLSSYKRDQLFDEIVDVAISVSAGVMDHETIDTINILQASLMAMRKAVCDLKTAPDCVLVDGNHLIPNLSIPQYAIIGGDARCHSISAASVIAKVTRDRIMDKYTALYPSFSFSQHKGYPTALHLEELREHGPCDIHRRSFKPVAELVDQYALF